LSRCFVTAYQLMYLNVSRTRRAGQDDMIVQCLKLLHKKLYTEKDMLGTKYLVFVYQFLVNAHL
jgi:hypothetical protein